MDKRSILGFILILAVLFLWPYWSKLINPPPPEQPGQDTTIVADTMVIKDTTMPVSSPVQPATMGETPAVQTTPVMQAEPTEPERVVNVDTEDMIVTLTSYGGIIKSIKLKHYFIENGEDGDSLVELLTPTELNPWNTPGALTLGIEDKTLPINNAPFKVEGRSSSLLKGDEPRTISFIYSDSATGASLRKDYTFFPEKYQMKLRLTIDNPRVFGFNEKVTVAWLVPNWPSEKELKLDLDQFAGFYYMGGEVVQNNDLKDGRLDLVATGSSQWVANRSKYFANALISEGDMGSEVMVSGHQSRIIDYENKSHEWKQFGVGLTFDIKSNTFTNDFLIYTGPLDYYRLEKIGFDLGQLVDMGWKVFRPFAIGILWVLVQLNKVLFNYGVVIIVFSLLMKVVFWPLTRKSTTSMMKMKELQPKLQEIKDKFSKDPQKLNAETMKVYKEYGVNPFGSCLPLLVQLPIFWALFSVLRNSIELRAAEFVFWITDLSQKDSTWVLPILMGLAMFFQQKMTITDPKQKMLAYIMPVVFVFIFGSMPSGLVLYWTVFSVVGVVEQMIIKRGMEEEKRAQTS
jgi:YidC/Oxa1 family membrane protein insertase